MSELERAFVTTSGAVWKEVEGSDGRTYHFKNGTPKSQNAWNAAQQHIDQHGEFIGVAIPSDKGPGYERKEVSPQAASELGKELAYHVNEKEGRRIAREAKDTVTLEIDGEAMTFETSELADLNERITNRHGPEAVMKY